jgi:hypothetical protein
MEEWQQENFDGRKITNPKSLSIVSTFLLLLPKLKATARDFSVNPHLTVVSSSLHNAANFLERHSKNIFEALNYKEKAIMAHRYVNQCGNILTVGG